MRACTRFDPNQDPPPDLAVESDVTSTTTLETYQVLQVPEIWIYANRQLSIYLLVEGEYQLSSNSFTFPSLRMTELVPRLITEAEQSGTRRMLKRLRQLPP